MGGQTLYFDKPCRIGAPGVWNSRQGFRHRMDIYVNIADSGVKALTYRVSGSYLIPATVSLWSDLNVIY